MRSGITVDGTFIGITWHSVELYFKVIRRIIDSGESAPLRLPSDDGVLTLLITPSSRVSTYIAFEEAGGELRDEFARDPFGNMPALIDDYLDPDDRLMAVLRESDLGEAVAAYQREQAADEAADNTTV